jgi:hypothetical protein
MLKKLILILVVFQQVISFAQTRDLAYYQQQAYQNNPVLRQNKNQQKILGLQQELIRIQNQKPQVYLSGDILLTPTFFSDNKFISFKNNYEAKSYGYDIFLTNRALYVGQVNVSKNLLGRPYVKANDKRTENLIQGIELDNLQIKHELDKNVIEQYIAVY